MTAAPPEPVYARPLLYSYNPPGILPGDGARSLSLHFERLGDGKVRVVGGTSTITSPFGGLVPYKGREYLHPGHRDQPRYSGLLDAVEQAYMLAEPEFGSGERFEAERVFPPTPLPISGGRNGTWGLYVDDNAKGDSPQAGHLFAGQLAATHPSPAIETLVDAVHALALEVRSR